MKQLILLLIILLLANNVFAKEISVKIKPEKKITTSNLDLKEGDSVNFIVSEDVFVNTKLYLKKGQNITAMITDIEDNDFFITPAKILIENFKAVNNLNKPIKFKGIIYKKGTEHPKINEIFVFDVIRGGEVQIKPEKDEFTIYLEDNL